VAVAPRQQGSRLLVLGAGAAQLGLLAAARARGLYVIAADRDPGAPGFRFADRRAIVSVEDEVGIERLADAERVDGVIAPGIDWPVAVAARVAAQLGLAHPLPPEVAARTVSKLKQRECFDRAGVAQPRWKLVQGPDDELGYPCVVKAPDRQGQRGLSLVGSPDELEPAVGRALAASRNRHCVIEELVEGPEVTVNALLRDGRFEPLTVTDRVTAAPPAFGVALAHVWPSEAAGAEAVEVARRAAEALELREGPVYAQLRVGERGPQVVELAARLGGGHDAELCRAALGLDLNGAALAAALGDEGLVEPPVEGAGGACVCFLVPPEGSLEEVTGLDEARRAPGVRDVWSYRRPPHVFGPLRRGADRAGAVLATGGTRGEARARAGRAADLVRFVTADVDAQALV